MMTTNARSAALFTALGTTRNTLPNDGAIDLAFPPAILLYGDEVIERGRIQAFV
jgi:hypothetical protein